VYSFPITFYELVVILLSPNACRFLLTPFGFPLTQKPVCGGLTLAGGRVPTKAALSLSSSAGQRKENRTKGLWVERRTGKAHSPITVTGKTDSTASFGHPPALLWGPPPYLLDCGHPWTAGGQPASPWSSPWAARESLLWRLQPLLPLLLH